MSYRPIDERAKELYENISDDGYDFDLDCEEVAAERGQIVVHPEPNEIQLDFDTEQQSIEFARRLSFLESEPYEMMIVKSKSGGRYHKHIYMRFEHRVEISDFERIAIQAMLGDDPFRVALNTRRAMMGQKDPSRLFESPDFVRDYKQEHEAYGDTIILS